MVALRAEGGLTGRATGVKGVELASATNRSGLFALRGGALGSTLRRDGVVRSSEEGPMDTREGSRWNAFVCAVTLMLLSPVIGMVLVFALLPALPIVLAIGAILGPMTLLKDVEPHEDLAPEEWEARRILARHAHA